MSATARSLEAIEDMSTSLVSTDANDDVDYCELDTARIPHINIHVFRENDAFDFVWEMAAADRRMVSANCKSFEGGLNAAIQKYATDKTPDLLIIETDKSDDELEVRLDELAEHADPGTQLIIVGHRNDIELYQRLLNMGVSSYLVFPCAIESLIAAIARIYVEPGKEKIGKIHAVIGAKGGVGASLVAQNVALEIAHQQDVDVLLVDLDMHFGTGSLNLDVDANQGLIELIDQAERLDVATLDRVLIKRGMHLNLLGTSAGFDVSRDLDSETIERLLDVASTHIPHIMLDIPHVWNEWVERALYDADTVTIVATPELDCLRNATTLLTQLKSIRPNDKPPALVMNQVGMPRRQEVDIKEIKSILKIQPMVSIPHDPRVFSRAASQGKMVPELGRRKPVAAAYEAIARTLSSGPVQSKPRATGRGWRRNR